MSYCRFENTLRDLRDCAEHFDDDLGLEESAARNRMLLLCERIVRENSDRLEDLHEARTAQVPRG